MSDCHSWLGVARSNRRGPCSRAVFAGAASMSPSSCRIRRTCCSEIPTASNRASTSRIRRDPQSWFSCFSATTWSRFTVLGFLRALFAAARPFSSAAGPPLRNARSHFPIAAPETPNALAVSASLVPRSRSCTAASLKAAGNAGPGRVPFFAFAISVSRSADPCQRFAGGRR